METMSHEGEATLQLDGAISNQLRKVLQVITSRDAEATDKVLGRVLEVAIRVVRGRDVVFRTPEVGVAGDRGGSVELAQTVLGLGLGLRVESLAAEELVRRDALLGAEAVGGLLELFV